MRLALPLRLHASRAPRAWAARLVGAGLVAAAAPPALAQAAAAPASAASQPAGPVVRPLMALPLQAAQDLLAQGKAQEALPKVAEAAAMPDRTPYENYMIERIRALAAQRLGDKPTVLNALEAAFATGQMDKSEQPALMEALISIAWDLKDHARVLRWAPQYAQLGGPNQDLELLRVQSLAATGDVAGAAVALRARLDGMDKAGKPVPESHLRLLLNYEQTTKDPAVPKTFERLAMAYPRPTYWSSVVSYAARDAGLDDRALLELYRLLRTTDNLDSGDLREEMAELSFRFGLPGEAKTVLDEGYAKGQMNTGPRAAARAQLRDRVNKQAAADKSDRAAAEAAASKAKDGNALAGLGWALLAELPAGAAAAAVEPGLALLEQGLAKGALRRTNEVRLHLGIAQLAAGRRDAARQTLAALAAEAGSDPLAPAIRLWSRFANAPAMLPARP